MIGSQLAEDKQTVADLKLTKDTAVYVYVQHPHKAKVHKNAMKEVESQSKKPALPVKEDPHVTKPRKNPPPPGGYSLEPPHQVPAPHYDPPRRDNDAMFRGPMSIQAKKPPPVGGIPVLMPVPQRNDDARFREMPLPVPIEEDYQRRPRPDPRPPSPPEPPGWECPACTYKNLPHRPGCEVCNNTRPDDYQPPPNYVPTDAEKKFVNNDQEITNVRF